MRATILILTFIASLASTAPAIAQEGHPLKGSWVGTWGPSKQHDNDGKDKAGKAVSYVLDGKIDGLAFRNRTISGTWKGGAESGPFKLQRQ